MVKNQQVRPLIFNLTNMACWCVRIFKYQLFKFQPSQILLDVFGSIESNFVRKFHPARSPSIILFPFFSILVSSIPSTSISNSLIFLQNLFIFLWVAHSPQIPENRWLIYFGWNFASCWSNDMEFHLVI